MLGVITPFEGRRGQGKSVWCFIFRPASWCFALQTLVEIILFNICISDKLKKEQKARNLQQIFAKKVFLKFAPKRWSEV